MKKIIYFFLLTLLSVSVLHANPFTIGNIVVVRIGDGSASLTSSGTAVFLEEYTPAGVLVQVIPMPTAISGSNKRFVLTGTSTSEGNVEISGDKHFITLGGYDADVGTATVLTAAGVNRVLAFVSENGTINTTTAITDGYIGSNIRSVYTLDGTSFWSGGTATSATNGGVRYTTLGGTTSVQLSSTVTNTRFVYVYNGQLYVSASSSTFLGVNAVGTGIPTTTGQTTVNYINTLTGSSSYGFSFSPDGNTCYIADDRAVASGGGIQKWNLSGGVWSLVYTLNTNLTVGCRGLAVNFSGTNPVIYATTSNSIIASATDAGASSPFTSLMTAATNTVYRGISFAPGVIVAPNAPVLVSPANNSVGNLTSVNLLWNKSAGATSYKVQVAADAGFGSLIVNDSTLTDSIKTLAGLNPLTSYWWRVNAKNAGGLSGFSSVFTFRTLGVPTQITGLFIPANGSVNQPTTVNFRWAKAQDQLLSRNIIDPVKYSPESITNYWFELTTDSISQPGIIRDSTLTDTNKTQGGLLNITSYYWRVKAKNQIGWGSFSFWQKFTTVVAAPAAPTLIAPANNATGVSTTPLLDWSFVPTATSYEVQLAMDTIFVSILFDSTTNVDSLRIPPPGLGNNVTYFWRVKSINAGGSSFSIIFRFTTGPVGLLNGSLIPTKYSLYTNYPNPFNPVTKIKFDIPKVSFTVVKIYDILGNEVKVLVNEVKQPGAYSVDFDASNFASGVYFYTIKANDFTDVKKMVLIK